MGPGIGAHDIELRLRVQGQVNNGLGFSSATRLLVSGGGCRFSGQSEDVKCWQRLRLQGQVNTGMAFGSATRLRSIRCRYIQRELQNLSRVPQTLISAYGICPNRSLMKSFFHPSFSYIHSTSSITDLVINPPSPI